jgi:hypothetical protein
MAFQGRFPWPISGVPVGRVPPHGAPTPPNGERANVKHAASGDAAYNSTRPGDVGRFWVVGFARVVEGEGFTKSLTVGDLDAGAAPKRRGPERGCVRRTSRSRTECEQALNHSNAPLSAMALRLGLRPQSRSSARGPTDGYCNSEERGRRGAVRRLDAW